MGRKKERGGYGRVFTEREENTNGWFSLLKRKHRDSDKAKWWWPTKKKGKDASQKKNE